MLDPADLTPPAAEWRMPLFSLGKLFYDSAELARRSAQQGALSGQSTSTEQQTAELARFDDAILRLEEFRGPYPAAAESPPVPFPPPRARHKSAAVFVPRRETSETHITPSE